MKLNSNIGMIGLTIAVSLIASIIFLPLLLDSIATQTDVVYGVVIEKKSTRVGPINNKKLQHFVILETEKLANTDDLSRGKSNSSKLQEQIEVGKAYQFKVYGGSASPLSTYRNILRVDSMLSSKD